MTPMKRCANCGTENEHSGSFCRNCGEKLPVLTSPKVDPSRPTAASGETEGRPAPLPHSGRCPACGADVPPGTNFCRSCGGDLQSAEAGPKVRVSTAAEDVKCPRCHGLAPAGHMFCPSCGAQLPTLSETPTPEEVKRITAGREEYRPDNIALGPTADGTSKSPLVRKGSSVRNTSNWGRLVCVNRDGSDGTTYHLSGEYMDVGSGRTQIRVSGDPHVADVHLRIEPSGGAVKVTPLDDFNGVLWRLREATEVLAGTEVLIGRELFRIDPLPEVEQSIEGVRQHGVALFASPVRRPWARMSHLWVDGTVGDVRHFFADEVVVGREEGDVVFPDDEFMSRQHAVFRRDNKRCILEDLGSSNGTFVRLAGATVVSDGDYLRLGDQMFRFESVST